MTIDLICTDNKIYRINYSEESPFYGEYLNNIIELNNGDTTNISIKVPFIYDALVIYTDIELYRLFIKNDKEPCADGELFICADIGAFFGSEANYISRIVKQLPNLVREQRYHLVSALERFLSFCSKDEYCNKILSYAESINNLKLVDIIESYKLNATCTHTLDHDIFDKNCHDIKFFDIVSYQNESRLVLYSTKNMATGYSYTSFDRCIELYDSRGYTELDEYILRLEDIGINIYCVNNKTYLFLWNKHLSITIMSYNSETYDHKSNEIYHDARTKRQLLEYFSTTNYNHVRETDMLQFLSNSSCFDVTNYIQTDGAMQYRIILPCMIHLRENLSASDF